MQEIAYLVHSEGDFDSADMFLLTERVPFLEVWSPEAHNLDVLCETNPPRLIKTHLPSHFFDKTLAAKNTKFISVLRNPKDTLVSFYHFYR